jgi:hypothetical protein
MVAALLHCHGHIYRGKRGGAVASAGRRVYEVAIKNMARYACPDWMKGLNFMKQPLLQAEPAAKNDRPIQ